jgi:hypothetical protein
VSGQAVISWGEEQVAELDEGRIHQDVSDPKSILSGIGHIIGTSLDFGLNT